MCLLQRVAAEPIDDPDADIRRDLRYLRVITIDDPNTKDVDDGLSIERIKNDSIKVWVHVADPARWLEFGSDVDLEGMKRGISLFLPTEKVNCHPVYVPCHLRANMLESWSYDVLQL